MDVLGLVFYGAVCGLLSWAGPVLGAPIVRLGVGVAVGIAAAGILPIIRTALG